MRATTQMLQHYRNDKVRHTSLEELSSMYRQQQRDYIVVEAYMRVRNIILRYRKKYPHLEYCDCASYALEKLEMCLLTYVPGGTSKFATYFSKVFNNKLREETTLLNYHKRCIIFNSTSLNSMMDNGWDTIGGNGVACPVTLPSNLTPNEEKYCKLLALDYGTNKEIAEYMDVSVMTLCNMRRSLRQKLECLL